MKIYQKMSTKKATKNMSRSRSSSPEHVLGVYFGNRGEEFVKLISSLLKGAKVKKRYIAALTTPESIDRYSAAFTSELVDPVNNYQVAEILGDLSGNKFIVWYMLKRFPQLNCTEGVKVLARLRINYGAKNSFAKIAEELGFWPFITATNDIRQRKKKDLLEDVFEAFIGTTESILDEKIMIGVGWVVVNDILTSIFNKMDISLRYEDLYDAKTRLKELFDMYEEKLGPLVYKDDKDEVTGMANCSVYRVDGGSYALLRNGHPNKKKIIGGNYVLIGKGSASLKADAQKNAAKEALTLLNSQGWAKPIPEVYRKFNEAEELEEKKSEPVDKEEIMKKCEGDINAMISTKAKTKYQSKYTSTMLAYYCSNRNVVGINACMSLGADPNIPDSDGLSPLDLIFMGEVDEDIVKRCMKQLNMEKVEKKMNKQIFMKYYMKYKKKYYARYVQEIGLNLY